MIISFIIFQKTPIQIGHLVVVHLIVITHFSGHFISTMRTIVSSSVHLPCARVVLLSVAYAAAETLELYFFKLSFPVLFVAALGRRSAPFGF